MSMSEFNKWPKLNSTGLCEREEFAYPSLEEGVFDSDELDGCKTELKLNA